MDILNKQVTINEILTETYSVLVSGLNRLLDIPVPLTQAVVVNLSKEVLYEDAMKLNYTQQEYLLALIEDLTDGIEYTKRELDKVYEEVVRDITTNRYPFGIAPEHPYQYPLKNLCANYLDVEINGDLLKAALHIYTLSHEVASAYYFGDITGITTLYLEKVKVSHKVEDILCDILKKRAKDMAMGKIDTVPALITEHEYSIIVEEMEYYIENVEDLDDNHLNSVIYTLREMYKETAFNISRRTNFRLYQRSIHELKPEYADLMLDELKKKLSAMLPMEWMKRVDVIKASRLKSIPPFYELEKLYKEIAEVTFEVVSDPPVPGPKLVDSDLEVVKALKEVFSTHHIKDNAQYFKTTLLSDVSTKRMYDIYALVRWMYCAEAEVYGVFNINRNYVTNMTIASIDNIEKMKLEGLNDDLQHYIASFVPAMNIDVYLNDM